MIDRQRQLRELNWFAPTDKYGVRVGSYFAVLRGLSVTAEQEYWHKLGATDRPPRGWEKSKRKLARAMVGAYRRTHPQILDVWVSFDMEQHPGVVSLEVTP